MSPSPLLLAAIFQDETTGESTSVIEGASKAAQEIPQETGNILETTVRNLFEGIAGYLISPTFIANVVATVIVFILATAFYRVAVHLIPRVLQWSRPADEASLDAVTLARIKRQDTAVTLVRNTLRYVTFALVALFIFSIFLQNVFPALAGATILAAIIGFGAQSFLRDIIAGFFILFENQYSVGDFVSVEPTKASGMVEEFGLRTTTIRALSGELIYIPNGSLIGVTNYVSGQQRFTIEVQLKDMEAEKRVLEEIQEGHDLYLIPPRLVDRNETPEGGPRLRLLAVVLPSTAWLVEENLVERIKAAAGEDSLAADPLVYKVDSRNVRRLREFIPKE
ncbi:MAG: Potassium efflux system KefA protein / Small-conductance mechanosensitive channel [uncultured Rubrobacteraceae bacterium]|uniref:Potassium efflux system KefA protein / Small-conductance mechanosensitive channel n=1 Tax=uncultured Rubrobacteraceae bacterium TaxID=349277 RepID=A0A6J4QVR6_9ACTN|nr:MAG: Potassium efflux system KefA protein / Small-conductance mechanosensitive channel [uncultured Rubrobacteraceae bacterium]